MQEPVLHQRPRESFIGSMLKRLGNSLFPTVTGRWEDRTYSKAEVFRKMKSWEREAQHEEFMRLHPVIIQGSLHQAQYFRDLLEEMRELGTDTITSKVWVTDCEHKRQSSDGDCLDCGA